MRRSNHISAGIYERMLPPLLKRAAALAMAVLRNRADAEDVVQEAAMKGLRAIETYDLDRPFAGWWLAIVRNCCRDWLRRRRADIRPVPLNEDLDAPPRDEPDGDNWEDIAAAMAKLSAPHRQVLEMRYFGECSYREIAEALDLPAGTVMSRLHSARKALAEVYLKSMEQ
jgi:RNA polymerase sigma-70 factor, ECF subfamily